MNKALKWVLIGLGVALVAFCVAMVAFRGFAFGPSFMMGGLGHGFQRPFGGMMFGMGLFMLLRVLFGTAVLGLAVFGIVSLFRRQKSIPASTGASVAPEVQSAGVNADPEKTCVKCSKPLQSDWQNCPYCGKKQ